MTAPEQRFPGFDVLSQRRHWDEATRAAIHGRLHRLPALRFFTATEEPVATSLLDRLVGQDDGHAGAYVPVVRLVDARLAEDQTDGWSYDTMPSDPQAWRDSLAALDDDALTRHGRGFAECDHGRQRALIEAVRTFSGDRWHGLPPGPVWSLWSRYAVTAFYSHPVAWNEIGFDGPAYPRGYRNLGVDRREPFEVRDADPRDEPLRPEPRS